MNSIRLAAVIPVYNNRATVAAVVAGVRAHVADVIVVDDGSTDGTAEELAAIPGIRVLRVNRNRGKGHALRLGFEEARHMRCTHALTVDADGQHLPEDIPAFLAAVRESPETLWIGNRVLDAGGAAQPARSRFGAWFGAFWYRFHTGLRIDDTQCGMRVYPLARMAGLAEKRDGFEYEIDVLIRAAWARVPVRQIPIHRRYLPPGERVSHFRPLRDFLRISAVNCRAALTRIFMPWRFLDAPGATTSEKVRLLFVRELTAHHSPGRAAAALALGAALGVSPFHGLQVVAAIGLSVLLRMNRALTVLGTAVSSPPFIPFWIAAGYGAGTIVMPDFAVRTLGLHAARLGFHTLAHLLNPSPDSTHLGLMGVQWFVGSLTLMVPMGAIVFVVSYPLLKGLERARSARPDR